MSVLVVTAEHAEAAERKYRTNKIYYSDKKI